MESSTHQQHYEASTKLANYRKPATAKVLASLFCLSLLLLLPCYSYLLPAIHSLVDLICINVNKNYMFLLFNGILVILKISCGVGSSPDGSDLHGVSSARYYEAGTKEKEVHEPSIEMIKDEVSLEEKEAECKEENSLVLVEEERNSCILVNEEEDGGQRENGSVEGNVDEDETELMSTEEWNRKFDDFIKNMRETIKTEAEQAKLAISWKVDQQL